MPKQIPLDNLMTEAEAAKMIRKSRRTLQSWRYKGVGPKYLRSGNMILYSPDMLMEFLESSDETGKMQKG